jgi:predicted 2-oxoglutarate/Fe(II)-dependent dioxygenase YbiX
MKIGSTKNIVIRENFISKEELDTVLSSLDHTITWGSNSMAGIPDKVTNQLHFEKPEAHAILKRAIDRVQQEIELHFGRPLEVNSAGIRRWDTGEFQPLHADGEDIEGHPNEAFIVDYGAVIYLNDDYEGGEIYFPDHNIDFKPKAGTLVFFPSNNMYIHGVRTITKGTRYTTPSFWVPTKYKIFQDEIIKKYTNNG